MRGNKPPLHRFHHSEARTRAERRQAEVLRTKKWAERNVWSIMCATELGLLPPTRNFSQKPETEEKRIRSMEQPVINQNVETKSTNTTSQESIFDDINPSSRSKLNERSANEAFPLKLVLHDHGYTLSAPPNSPEKSNEESPKLRTNEEPHAESLKLTADEESIVESPKPRSNEESNAESFIDLNELVDFHNSSKSSDTSDDNLKTEIQTELGKIQDSVDDRDASFCEKTLLENDANIAKKEGKCAKIVAKNETIQESKRILRKRPDKKKKRNSIEKANKQDDYINERSKRVESSKEARTTSKLSRVTLRTRPSSNLDQSVEKIVPCKKTKILKKKTFKNDYEDSDIDESLLVDPSTDLPQSLRESLHTDIRLSTPDFDVGVDLNYEADSKLTSIMESLERDFFIQAENKIAAKKETEKFDDSDQLSECSLPSEKTSKKRVRLNEITTKNNHKNIRKTRKSADSEIIANKVAVIGKKTTSLRTTRKMDWDKENTRNEPVGSVTRLNSEDVSSKKYEIRSSSKKCEPTFSIGMIVWGKCRGWWPGLVVDASEIGMFSSSGKSWIYWIGEHRVSHLSNKNDIQTFSTCLHERMFETLRVKSSKDPYYVTCLAALELINDRILHVGSMTKPYHIWAEKHFGPLKNIDRFIIRPYPPEMQARLDKLRKINGRETEKYLSSLEGSQRSLLSKISYQKLETKGNLEAKKTVKTEEKKEPKEMKETKKTEKTETVPDPEQLPLSKQKPGTMTWAMETPDQPWWPALIVDYRDCGMIEPRYGCQWVCWYGDKRLSQVNHNRIIPFEIGITRMKNYLKNCKREMYNNGVVEAAKYYGTSRGYKTENWTIGEVIDWFEKFEKYRDDEDSNSLPGIPGDPDIAQRYPTRIIEAFRLHSGKSSLILPRDHCITTNETMERVMMRKSKIPETICLMCLESQGNEKGSIEHPFFVGRLCENCGEKYMPTIHAYGDDAKGFFCTLCAGSDTLVLCDNDSCPRVFCIACMKYILAPDLYDYIMLSDSWQCFFCDASMNLRREGFIDLRLDWKQRIGGLFNSSGDSTISFYDDRRKERSEARVLSLFDGIAAGHVAMDKLGIRIGAYYASEIDPDAETVSSAHFGDRITRLGDVRAITESKIREIGPIDVLIGGSPCNDLSYVNPARLGLHDPNGTGILFFEYCRIKNLLESISKEAGRAFFWLYENVAWMSSKYSKEMSEHLGREPYVIDSANYSPQHRSRFFWTNLPTVSFPLSNQDLQDVLAPNCNRRALVKTINTVTTRAVNVPGPIKGKPILMDEMNDGLWITELEEIFGFPRHYTDVKNLCATKRQKLIGMSWSVQAVTEILRPLCNFFANQNGNSA